MLRKVTKYIVSLATTQTVHIGRWIPYEDKAAENPPNQETYPD